MGKAKTKKAAKKRLKVTGSGKIVHKQTGKSHLLGKKSSRRKRRLSGRKQLNSKKQAKQIKNGLLPND
ncbi:MAG: 50S ribosomal protein L35 [Armatimonadota bacterium]